MDGADGSHRKHPLLRRVREHALVGHLFCVFPSIVTDVLLYLASIVSTSRQLLSRFLRIVVTIGTVTVNELCARTW